MYFLLLFSSHLEDQLLEIYGLFDKSTKVTSKISAKVSLPLPLAILAKSVGNISLVHVRFKYKIYWKLQVIRTFPMTFFFKI